VFRRRRFAIAVLVTAMVFGMALIFDGVKQAVNNEVDRVVAAFDADRWLVADGVTGPFTATAVIPAELAAEVATQGGVERADPVVLTRGVARVDPDKDVNIVGFVPRGLGTPPVEEGRSVEERGEIVADESLDVEVGDRVTISGQPLRVVGVADGLRYNFGAPAVFMHIRDAQELAFDGRSLAMAVAVDGRVSPLPDGITERSNVAVVDDLHRTVQAGVQTIDFVSLLLWIIAIGIIGSVVYLNALERSRDFAVLKATGSPNATIVGGLAVQSLILSLVAAILAVGVARVVALGLPFPAELDVGSYLMLFGTAVIIGLLASLIGARRALSTDPALAFGGA
jgi:putative ABC transport system permease protein